MKKTLGIAAFFIPITVIGIITCHMGEVDASVSTEYVLGLTSVGLGFLGIAFVAATAAVKAGVFDK